MILLLLLLVVGGAGFFLYYRAHDAPVALADSGSAPPPATTSADAAPPTTSAAPPAPAPVASPSSSELTPPAPKPPPARRPDSNRCECVGSDHRRTLLCITPIATCNCIGPNLRRLCVVPYVYPAGSTWPACPDTKSAYSRPDAKEGAACSGYDADDKTRTSPPASGTLSCDFCSGARQYPGYHGQACRGVDASGEWIDGTWRCPSSTVNTR